MASIVDVSFKNIWQVTLKFVRIAAEGFIVPLWRDLSRSWQLISLINVKLSHWIICINNFQRCHCSTEFCNPSLQRFMWLFYPSVVSLWLWRKMWTIWINNRFVSSVIYVELFKLRLFCNIENRIFFPHTGKNVLKHIKKYI